jgi:CheY-like chemotaxis protein
MNAVAATGQGTGGQDDRPLAVIVDPSRDFRTILVQFFTHDGFAAAATSDPDEALDWALTRQPAVMVGEHPLSLRDGRPLCEALLDHPATAAIPFLAVTARAFPEDLDSARRTHAHGVLSKPAEPAAILSHIHRLLAGEGR